MDCKHEERFLMGDAHGIVCRNCGKRFAHRPDAQVEAKAEKVDEEKLVKKAPARKPAAKKGAKA